MKWYTEYGYKNNPVESDPFKTKEDPLGYETEINELLYNIEAGNSVIIEGPENSGKTLLLSKVIERFGGNGDLIYVDSNHMNKRLDIESLILGNEGFLRRTFKKKPKGMILLLDNILDLPLKTYELLQYYYDQDYLKSIIFSTKSIKKLNLPESFLNRIGKRIIKTKALTMEEAVDLVLTRLDQDLISQDKLEKLYVISDKDLKKFLKNVERVLSYMAENDEEELDFKTISKVVNGEDSEDDADDIEEESVMVCEECGEPLKKVGLHYRCPECDYYCPVCGILINEDDYDCPNCGAEFEFEEEE